MNPRWAISLFITLPLALSHCAFAGDANEILIKSGTIQHSSALIEGERNGKAVELECVSTESSCRVPKPGRYLVIEATNSLYEDCGNVDLFEISSAGKRGQKIGTYCDLSGPSGLITVTDSGLWDPPSIDLPDEHPSATIPKEMIATFQVGSTQIILNKTARSAAERALGGTVGMQGDAGDWEAWLCYHGRNSKGRWMLWLLSSEVDNENISGFQWMQLSPGQIPDHRCKLIPGDNAVRLPVTIHPGMSEPELRRVLGKPTLVSGNLLEYLHEHEKILDHLDYTVTNDVNVVLDHGEVRAIQVWRSVIN